MDDIKIGGKTLGQLAFEAYRAEVGGNTFDDRPIPVWDELHGDRARVHRGWEAAAAEVARLVRVGGSADEARSGPQDFRPQRSRWQPLDLQNTQIVEDLPQRGEPADEEAVTRSRAVEISSEHDA